MIDFTKLKAEEIREIIKNEFGLSEEEVQAVKGKSSLKNLYLALSDSGEQKTADEAEEIVSLEDILEESVDTGFDLIDDDEEVDVSGKINRASPDWSINVLNKLRPDEKDTDAKGNPIPKTDGLKRLIEEVVGEIIDIDNDLIQAPCPENQFIATVKSRVSVGMYDTDKIITYTGIADCKRSDCPPPFDKFVSAIAETRAEGRAYRKILALKNTTTFEEVLGADQKNSDLSDGIADTQINWISTICPNTGRGLNLNVQELFKSVTGKQYNNISRYSQEEAFAVISLINAIEQDESKRPADVGGYDPSWKQTFGS